MTTPATCQASLVRPAGGDVKSVRRKNNSPAKNPIDLELMLFVI